MELGSGMSSDNTCLTSVQPEPLSQAISHASKDAARLTRPLGCATKARSWNERMTKVGSSRACVRQAMSRWVVAAPDARCL